jgi:hypothetical protein
VGRGEQQTVFSGLELLKMEKASKFTPLLYRWRENEWPEVIQFSGL